MTYPALPEGAETALCLFGCAFGGENDGRYLVEAGLDVTFVDIDPDHVARMTLPGEYVVGDAFDYAAAHIGWRKWDVVSVDPFTGSAMNRVWAEKHSFLALARRLLVLGCSGYMLPSEAEEWGNLTRRSATAFWCVRDV